jgi:DNA repair protein RadC
MRTRPRSAHRLYVRSPSGAVVPAEPCYSTGFVADADPTYLRVTDDEVIAAALRILSRRLVRSGVLRNPRVVREYVAMRLAALEYEVFGCLYLDSHHRVIAFEELFRGTIDGASVHPREVVKQVLIRNAAAVIFVHNHPSGIAEPSDVDQLTTHHLRQALALLEVRVLDHLIVGGATVTSLAERGLL